MLSDDDMSKRWADGAGYDAYVRDELDGFRAEAWRGLVESHFPHGSKLDILDIGTGPGFFPCILGHAGHKVTGIDSSCSMLSYARANTENWGVDCNLLLMGADDLGFPDESFDLVISRNVVWTLPYPSEAFAQWKRVLKPGGMILIYDANWHLPFYDEQLARNVEANERHYKERFGHEFKVCRDDKPYYDSLPLSSIVRPTWDVRALENLGFVQIGTCEDVGRFVYEEWEQDLYSATPLFEIKAIKPRIPSSKQPIYDYWQDRASSFGLDETGIEAWGRLMQEEIPPGQSLRVLDVGTGTGAMAIAMARRGHSVTGIDLCPAMLEKAQANAKKENLDISFLCCDADELPFAEGSFDVVINRNVLWNIVDPSAALARWREVLADDGTLMYFDSAWYYYLFDEDSDRKRRRTYQEGTAPRYRDIETAAYSMVLSDKKRPEWDRENLPAVGFEVKKIADVSEAVWNGDDCERYSFAPQFMVVAKKA